MGVELAAIQTVGGAIGGQAATGVAIGAAVGSVIPGLGTVAGAAIGAIVGAFIPAGQKYPSADRTLGRFYRAGAPEWFSRALYASVLASVKTVADRQQLLGAGWDAVVKLTGLPVEEGGTKGYVTGAPVPVRKDDGLGAYLSAVRSPSGAPGSAIGSVDWIYVARELGLVPAAPGAPSGGDPAYYGPAVVRTPTTLTIPADPPPAPMVFTQGDDPLELAQLASDGGGFTGSYFGEAPAAAPSMLPLVAVAALLLLFAR